MAIFHLNESNISRSDGRSAVACAAYRACEKLEDQTFGKTQDYTKKKGLEYKNIYAPDHTSKELLDRQTLWNAVEKKEFNANGSMKANARLAKEYTCALPHELTDKERIKIVDDFCHDFAKEHNVIVDACIHAPHDHGEETNNKNYHVHIMFTTRLINEKGELGKKQRDFNDIGPQILKNSRANFASVINKVLEEAGLDERVDHRSYKDQGLDFLEPTHHEGHEATALRRQGIDTEISLTNDAIKAKNLDAARDHQQIIKGLNQEIIVPGLSEDQLDQLENELRLTEAEERELLAELANLNQEEERLQEEAQQIESAYDDFTHCQNLYAEFAHQFYILQKSALQNEKQIEVNYQKTERWLEENKREFFRDEKGTFYDAYHYTQASVKTPDFYTTKKDIDLQKHENWKGYAVDVEKLSAEYNIEKTVGRLRQCSEILEKNSIELPTKKPTFWQKIKGEYVHSFDTLSDFDNDIKPVIEDNKADDLRIEREKIQQEQQRKEAFKIKQAEWARDEKYAEEDRLKKEANERNLRVEREERQKQAYLARKELENRWKNEPKEPQKPEDDRNNDYSP